MNPSGKIQNDKKKTARLINPKICQKVHENIKPLISTEW